MLSETVQQALNKQLTMELAASHNYLAIAAYFESLNLEGFAHWYEVQSNEEREHAMKFYEYVNDRGGRAHIGALADPQSEFGSPLDAAQQALHHEQRVTAAINSIYELAGKEGDYATQSMLKWFIDEQVEEEKNADLLIHKLKVVGDDGPGLLRLDHELASRGGE